jgi:fatty-acyl-CoA synthase
MELSERTLGEWLEYWAETTPEKEYIVYSDRNLRFTWSKFNDRVDAMAKVYCLLVLPKALMWVFGLPMCRLATFLYASAKIGAVLVTVNTNYKQHELEYLVENSDMHTLCIIDGTWDCDYVEMTYNMLPELKTCQRGH